MTMFYHRLPSYQMTTRRSTTSKRKSISVYKEAFHYYSRPLQHTLSKATKGEPHRFVPQCNRTNSSGFETWRQLHATYDQGEKEQQQQQ
eukprot:2322610-Amphidinium_carterae.1